MSIGMSFDQYWNGDVRMIPTFSDAYERKMEQENFLAWLHGVYVYDAVSSVASAALSKSKSKIRKYSESPYPITDREKRVEKVRRIKKTLEFIEKGNQRTGKRK